MVQSDRQAAPRPFFSVVVVTLNPGVQLRACIASIISQDIGEDDCELVVIDGGSTDGTVDYLQRLSSPDIRWKSEADAGIGDAWNKALNIVRGEWILFLGADDLFYDSCVLRRLHPKLEGTDSLVCFGPVVLRGGRWDQTVLGSDGWRRRFPFRMSIPHQGAFHRKALFVEQGQFDTSLKIALDYEILARPCVRDRIEFMPGPPVSIMGQSGISSTHIVAAISEAYTVQRRHRTANAVLLWFSFHAQVARHRLFRRR